MIILLIRLSEKVKSLKIFTLKFNIKKRASASVKGSIETYRALIFGKGTPISKQCLNDIHKRILLMRSGTDPYENACCGSPLFCNFFQCIYITLFYKFNLYISAFNQYTKLAPPFHNYREFVRINKTRYVDGKYN